VFDFGRLGLVDQVRQAFNGIPAHFVGRAIQTQLQTVPEQFACLIVLQNVFCDLGKQSRQEFESGHYSGFRSVSDLVEHIHDESRKVVLVDLEFEALADEVPQEFKLLCELALLLNKL